MANEPFDIKKMLSAPFTSIYWVKSLMIGLGIMVILVVGFAIRKAYFKKPSPSQNQLINAADGSNVKVVNTYYNDRKRSLIPFVEGYVGQDNVHKTNTGIRAGVRFEW